MHMINMHVMHMMNMHVMHMRMPMHAVGSCRELTGVSAPSPQRSLPSGQSTEDTDCAGA